MINVIFDAFFAHQRIRVQSDVNYAGAQVTVLHEPEFVTEKQLGALLPSMLDRVFKGEL